ncbi:outer membrane protein assembly factor BamD [Flaviaesturariibacter aridisoli]|uniref:Outer membrane protein assembly factor BamD n=1 Tax=Flaviaesturariibacter aridisoli TaxID=2545761 RepID=A0A4R4E0W3_9BACT|nr:outer membrane protein assembly factor BamD [Flaviaesturariibacter aridisoli]TCZ73006.1 outer membrane protein assembly factor BamD [Flaviaesturariibacter aridisoli]
MRLFLVLCLGLMLASCDSVSKVLKSKDPEYKLRKAEDYFAKKKYSFAQQIFEDIMPYFKGTQKFEDIYYKYAYTAYYQHDWVNAENLFKTYVEVFPHSTRSEEMEYMRAYTYYRQSPKPELDQTNTIKAMGMMQTFINTHPGSARNKEAGAIVDASRAKLEAKDRSAAKLYFDLGQYRAAATAYEAVMNNYPDSQESDMYLFMAIKSYYLFAQLSVEEKREERYGKVVDECTDFMDRFPQSSYVKEVQQFLSLSQNQLKAIAHEPSKTPA